MADAARKQFWLPLESNPEMLNEFSAKIGAGGGAFAFHDVYGLDAELLAMVPKPCAAVTLLFPSSKLKEAKATQLQELEKSGYAPDDGIFFIKQYVGNACGTIAALHALSNNPHLIQEGSDLATFVAANKELAPAERGNNLSSAEFVRAATSASAQGGQTQTPELGEDVDHHFITFISHAGAVYELDGAKPYPINHGPAGDDLLAAVAEVIKARFIAVAPDGMFNMMALAPAAE